MNLYDYKGFLIEKSLARTQEAIAVHTTCLIEKIPVRLGWNIDPFRIEANETNTMNANEIPVGSVSHCRRWIKKSKYRCEQESSIANHYPKSLSKYINRKIWIARAKPTIKCFIKPVEYKTFTSFVFDPECSVWDMRNCKTIRSEIVVFEEEWRYYITNGTLVFSSWYKGKSEDQRTLPPAPPIDIPEGFYGTIDMGLTDKGTLELVECHLPFACGWYGKMTTENNRIYTQWLIDGRKYMDTLLQQAK